MAGRIPRPTGKEMLRFLERRGFVLVRIRGSHHFLRKGGLRTSVPIHGKQALPIGTFLAILADIRMSREEFIRLWQER